MSWRVLIVEVTSRHLLYFGRNHKMSCFVWSDLSTTVCIPVCTGLLEPAIKVELCRKCSILIVPLSHRAYSGTHHFLFVPWIRSMFVNPMCFLDWTSQFSFDWTTKWMWSNRWWQNVCDVKAVYLCTNCWTYFIKMSTNSIHVLECL